MSDHILRPQHPHPHPLLRLLSSSFGSGNSYTARGRPRGSNSISLFSSPGIDTFRNGLGRCTRFEGLSIPGAGLSKCCVLVLVLIRGIRRAGVAISDGGFGVGQAGLGDGYGESFIAPRGKAGAFVGVGVGGPTARLSDVAAGLGVSPQPTLEKQYFSRVFPSWPVVDAAVKDAGALVTRRVKMLRTGLSASVPFSWRWTAGGGVVSSQLSGGSVADMRWQFVMKSFKRTGGAVAGRGAIVGAGGRGCGRVVRGRGQAWSVSAVARLAVFTAGVCVVLFASLRSGRVLEAWRLGEVSVRCREVSFTALQPCFGALIYKLFPVRTS
ncbi:hypothetical protein P171DRAFT_202123 [Karstenula rhodostoma CBS 690.94]|uniref:Uncharacterized protein n=1 Tax=Karstenula rhodostoma CBS 690.94 TaxID=1392251 RepID=A0A9P4PRC7_9PLEO|nr:hypothetical protein P171DRAFT_202123 [Karstenula rhodostoma CBS 690.94]